MVPVVILVIFSSQFCFCCHLFAVSSLHLPLLFLVVSFVRLRTTIVNLFSRFSFFSYVLGLWSALFFVLVPCSHPCHPLVLMVLCRCCSCSIIFCFCFFFDPHLPPYPSSCSCLLSTLFRFRLPFSLRPDVARGTLPLAAAVAVELAETGRPVLAAGGVVSGRGLLAALALGCDGVVMGTR